MNKITALHDKLVFKLTGESLKDRNSKMIATLAKSRWIFLIIGLILIINPIPMLLLSGVAFILCSATGFLSMRKNKDIRLQVNALERKAKEKKWFSWFWLIFWFFVGFGIGAMIYLIIKMGNKK
jgi:hypothetical protein